jgi:[ribosomal protein S18]-alanine N-acetyltransferase
MGTATEDAIQAAQAERRAMTEADLDSVLAIEATCYAHPWSRGNFRDSLRQQHVAWLLQTSAAQALAYCIAMPAPGEWHLLNLSVAPPWQGRGLARRLLEDLLDHANQQGAGRLLLEVRASNLRAQKLYVAAGFSEIGRRRGYYPAWRGQREDALVWAKPLGGSNAL